MITNPDQYFVDGCGRCPKFSTPACKIHRWIDILNSLRENLKNTELKEEVKWGVPCYSYNGKNILMLSAFNEYCAISFFKGALLKDPRGVLIQPTKNSNADRSIRFTNLEKVNELKEIILDYIKEAVEIENSGLKVKFKPVSDYEIPLEFQTAMDNDQVLKAAFEALTPGRQKGYILYFSQPKQSKTVLSRIEKCTPKIMDGLGLNDRYK